MCLGCWKPVDASAGGLMFISTCTCAGTGCGGHLVLSQADITPVGWQGAAQHTYTMACDGFHEPGPCPAQAGGLAMEFFLGCLTCLALGAVSGWLIVHVSRRDEK